MAAVAGVAFVTIQYGNPNPLMVWQCLVAFQPVIDLVNALPQCVGLDKGNHPPNRVSA